MNFHFYHLLGIVFVVFLFSTIGDYKSAATGFEKEPSMPFVRLGLFAMPAVAHKCPSSRICNPAFPGCQDLSSASKIHVFFDKHQSLIINPYDKLAGGLKSAAMGAPTHCTFNMKVKMEVKMEVKTGILILN